MMDLSSVDLEVFSHAIKTYEQVRGIALGLIGAIFTARIALLVIQAASSESYFDLIKQIVSVMIALSLTPIVAKTVLNASTEMAESFRYEEPVREKGSIDELAQKIPFLNFMWSLAPIAITHVARAIYSIVIGLLIAITPIILVMGLLSFEVEVSGLLKTFLALSLWPVTWNILGLLAHQIWPAFSQTSLMGVCYWMIVHLLQMLSPIFSFILLSQVSPTKALGAVWPKSRIARGFK